MSEEPRVLLGEIVDEKDMPLRRPRPIRSSRAEILSQVHQENTERVEQDEEEKSDDSCCSCGCCLILIILVTVIAAVWW